MELRQALKEQYHAGLAMLAGLSPVEAAAYSIDQHNQSGAWNQALLQNGEADEARRHLKMSETPPK